MDKIYNKNWTENKYQNIYIIKKYNFILFFSLLSINNFFIWLFSVFHKKNEI